MKQFPLIMFLVSLNVLNAVGPAPDRKTLRDVLAHMSEKQLQPVEKVWLGNFGESEYLRSTLDLSNEGIEQLTPAPSSDELKDRFKDARGFDFSNNKITGEVAPETFAGLKNVQMITLNGNEITRITPDAFKANNSLQWVFFTNNPNMDDVTFKDLTQLWGIQGTAKRVDLENVPMLHAVTVDGLTKLTAGMFGKKLGLKHDWCKDMTIDLSRCDIEEVEDDSFEEDSLREKTIVKIGAGKINDQALIALARQLVSAGKDRKTVTLEIS